jgi:nicotinamidase-related amidase
MPRVSLASLVDPAHTALVTQECQGSVIGPDSGFAELAAEAHRQAVPNMARLLPAARSRGVRVVHCLFHRRADGLGANTNARLFTAAANRLADMSPGSAGSAVIPDLGPEAGDMYLARFHGVGPMGGTDLDAVLRNMGVTTIIPTGVSVNVAITNFVMDAVNAGYHVVLPRDAVAGVPAEYAEAVIDNTLSLLATVTTTDAVLEAWHG